MELIIEIIYHQKNIFYYQNNLINREKYTIAIFNKDYKVFKVYIVAFDISFNSEIHSSKKT